MRRRARSAPHKGTRGWVPHNGSFRASTAPSHELPGNRCRSLRPFHNERWLRSGLARLRGRPLSIRERLAPMNSQQAHQSFPCTLRTPCYFIQIAPKYTRWMKRARAQAQQRPGFVIDARALKNKGDKLLVCGIPRQGQALEIFLYNTARFIQEYWKSYRRRLQHESACTIQRFLRICFAMKTFTGLRAIAARRHKLVQKTRALRTRRRFSAWKNLARHNHRCRAITARFLVATHDAIKRYFFDCFVDIYMDAKEAADKTLRAYHKYKIHKCRCRALFAWIDFWWKRKSIRNFVLARLYRRWHSNVAKIIRIRQKTLEYRSAVAIQAAYRSMRCRDMLEMRRMKAEGDVVAFKLLRKHASTRIQCRWRVCLAHLRFDARVIAKEAALECVRISLNAVYTMQQHLDLLALKKVEMLRVIDEDNYIRAHLMRAEQQLPTFPSRPKSAGSRLLRVLRLSRGRSWVGSKIAQPHRKHLKLELRRQMKFSSYACRLSRHQQVEIKKAKFKKMIMKERQKILVREARDKFREMWPPPYHCKTCGESFVQKVDAESHVCVYLDPFLDKRRCVPWFPGVHGLL